jgi:hypothetical protein
MHIASVNDVINSDLGFSSKSCKLPSTTTSTTPPKFALWTATSYDAYNKPKSILHGNGLLTRNVYSSHNNNLTSIEIGRGGNLINNMNYGYDNHNNITGIANSITDESHTKRHNWWLSIGRTLVVSLRWLLRAVCNSCWVFF